MHILVTCTKKRLDSYPLTSIVMTREIVLEKLNSLNSGKSTGLDG